MSSLQKVANKHNVPVHLMANQEVPIEREAVEQALSLLEIEGVAAASKSMILTPDLHRGSGIPVGVCLDLEGLLVPGMIGKDIGCGMRLLVLEGLDKQDIDAHKDEIVERLRQIFFGGEREVWTSPKQREAILREGLVGLFETIQDNQANGLWKFYDQSKQIKELDFVFSSGCFATQSMFGAFSKYQLGSERKHAPDSQLGSLGGGNHFCEIGLVEELLEAQTAHAWNLKQGSVIAFIHTGSLVLGSNVGQEFKRQEGQRRDELDTLPADSNRGKEYISAMNNAANFASANRLVLGLMATKAISEAIGKEISAELVYDSPHNFIEEIGNVYRHRKGATPALGVDALVERFSTGTPILLPGSMGSSSWVMVGTGQEQTLETVSHGAGRALSRGKAARTKDLELDKLTIVNPIDPLKMKASGRRDLLDEYQKRLQEESPTAYKPIEPVVDSVVEAKAARKVSMLKPLITVKG